MALETQILINNYSITPEFADALTNFTGDVEGSIRLLEASEKDVIVTRVKFISSKKMAYGAMILFYNYQSGIPEFIFCAVSYDVALSKIRMDGDWREFFSDIQTFMQTKEADHDAAARIEAEILSSHNIPYVSSFFMDRNAVDLVNMKRFLISSISKVLLDTNIVLKMIQSDADVFKFRNMMNDMRQGLKIVPKRNADLVMLVNLVIDPVLAPIGGVDIDRIPENEEVLVKIIDDRDIAKYIVELMGAVDTTGSTQALFGKVVRNQRGEESENNHVTLQFGPGIYGTFAVGSKVRVQTRERKNPVVEKSDAGHGIDTDTMQTIRNISDFDSIKVPEMSQESMDELKDIKATTKVKTQPIKIFNVILLVLIAVVTITLLILLFLS